MSWKKALYLLPLAAVIAACAADRKEEPVQINSETKPESSGIAHASHEELELGATGDVVKAAYGRYHVEAVAPIGKLSGQDQMVKVDGPELWGIPGSVVLDMDKHGRVTNYNWVSAREYPIARKDFARAADSLSARYGKPAAVEPDFPAWIAGDTTYSLSYIAEKGQLVFFKTLRRD